MKTTGNIMLVANWESNVGYAWWLMENFWITIANHLKPKGIDSILIYPLITEIPETIDKTDIKILEHDFYDHSLNGLKKLRHIIKNNDIKHIYLTDHPSYTWLYVALRIWGVKTIIIHDHAPGERTAATGIKHFIKSLVQRIPYFTADHFIAVTDFVYERLKNVSCIPVTKCHCAPNGIHPIDLQSSDKTYASKLFDIPNDSTIVITTGRATFYKGIDFFIECANEIVNVQGRADFQFIYCGDGPDLDQFRKMVAAFKLNDNFIFAGRRSDVRNILPSCHIGLHCAIGEVGYSLSILEYMSAGLVTIVPDNPSTSSAIEHNINGFVYEHKNIQSAVKMILDSTDKDFISPIIHNAIHTVQNQYSIHNTNKSLCKIFDHLIS